VLTNKSAGDPAYSRESFRPLLRCAAVAAVVLTLLSVGPPASVARTGTAQGSGAKWGLAVSGSAQNPGVLQDAMGRQFESRGVYYPLCCYAYPNADALATRSVGGLVYININSWHAIGDRKVCYPWRGVAAGTYDSLLRTWVEELKAFGYQRTIITFHHEPSVTTNPNQPHCGTPAEYRNAFHHVYAYFRAHGIDYPFVWTMMANCFQLGTAKPYEPPLGNFQIVGVDGFNRLSQPWRSATRIFGSAEQFATAVGKPLLIGEIGSEEDPKVAGRKATWITAAATTFRNWGNVMAVEWTDTDGFRPTTSTSALNAWVKASELAYYQ
jgi:hypothetical protein